MKNVTSKNKLIKQIKFIRCFFGRVGFSSRPDFLETKSRLLRAVFVSKSKGCFIMKKVTYPEELLLGREQFSLQKGVTITNKKHMDYREEFLSGR